MKGIVDKEIIAQRSLAYGNNFPFLSKLWNNFLKLRYGIEVELEPADVAFMFSLHKISRLANAPDDEDTMKDMINYSWLGTSYQEYIKLMEQLSLNNKDKKK